MSPFKKWFLVPVVGLILLGSAVNSQAQFQCTAMTGVPPIVRWEGFAEYVADLILNCSGGTPGTPVTANFQIFLNTNVTSNLLDNGSFPATEALLMVNDPPPGSQVFGTNVFRGFKSNNNSIVWPGVTFNQPGGGTLTIRMTNLRVSANSLPLSNPPATVQALISVTSATSIPVNNPTQVLGFCEKGQTFWMSDFTSNTFTINLEENFSTAFKKKIEVNVSGDPISQNNPGFLYFTESGFTTNFSPADLTGKADTGTRLVARYKNLPSGTFLTVPTLVSSNTSPFLLARLLSNVNPDFSGGETASTGLLPVCQNSSMAVWEIVGPSGITGSSVIDRFAIPVTVSGPWGAMEVFGSYGPINITDIMSLDAPEPRFYDAAAGLFPYHNCPNTYLPVIMKQGGLI